MWERAGHRMYRVCPWGRLSIRVCAAFPFGFKGGMWDVIVLIIAYLFTLLVSPLMFINHKHTYILDG